MNKLGNQRAEPEAYRRASNRLLRWLKACVICPRICRVDRLAGQRGFCQADQLALVNLAQLHFDEEPPISGWRGSGTIFFSGCTLACRYCQNHLISQQARGEEMNATALAEVFISLARQGAHNLNLVTPTPHLVVILEALALFREAGYGLPVVYNTSGYERAATIKLLEGLIDVYLPDYKYADDQIAFRLSGALEYVRHTRAALAEMHRQVGPLAIGGDGLAKRGVLVRHLVLPAGLSTTPLVLADLVRLGGGEIWVSLMAQYTPLYLANKTPGLERRLTLSEYQAAMDSLEELGIVNGFVQELDSADAGYLPSFRA